MTQCPKKQKRLGRTVCGFNQLIWDENSSSILHQGNYNKFNQNPWLLNSLEATVGTTLVETSLYDSKWGIALTQDDPRSLRRETWLGQSRLGEILRNLRDEVFFGCQTPTTSDISFEPIHAQKQVQEQVQEHIQERKKQERQQAPGHKLEQLGTCNQHFSRMSSREIFFMTNIDQSVTQ